MNKLTSAVAAVGLVLVASTPAFANRAGGPDTTNPIVKEGVAATQNAAVTGSVEVWAGQQRQVQPTVLADAVTGASSDPTEVVHVGRLAYRIQKDHAVGIDGTAVASSGRLFVVNG